MATHTPTVPHPQFDTDSELHKVAEMNHDGFKLVLRIRADDPDARVPLVGGRGLRDSRCTCNHPCCDSTALPTTTIHLTSTNPPCPQL